MFALALLAAVSAHLDQLRCSGAGDRIVISISAGLDKRIGSLAVVSHRRWLTLVDGEHHLADFRPGVWRVVLLPASQMGAYWGLDGRERRVKVFAGRGVYRIVFADNLETELENMNSVECLVRVR